jgi:hypothetical protein
MTDLPPGFELEHPPLPDGFHLEGTKPITPIDANPTSGNSFLQNLAAGAGQGMTDAVVSANQMLAHAPVLGQFNQLFGAPSAEQVDEVAKRKAEIDAPLLKTGGGVVGNIAAQGLLTAPIGGEAGTLLNAVKTGAKLGGAGALLTPTTGDNFGVDKLEQVAKGTAIGAGAGGGLNVAGKVATSVLPGNLVATVANFVNRGANKSDFAKEGEALAARTGIDMTPGQISGGKAQTTLENVARQSITSKSAAFEGDTKIGNQWVDYVNRTIDGITQGGGSPAEIGERVQGVVKNAVSDLTKARDTQAAADYGAIRQMTRGAATIEPNNTNELLKSIVSEYSGVGSPSADALASFAKKQLSNVAPVDKTAASTGSALLDSIRGASPQDQQAFIAQVAKQDPEMAKAAQTALNPGANNATAPAQGNLDKLLMLRQYISKVAGGQTKISGDNVDRKIATQLLGTIDQDLQDAEGQVGPIGQALKQANANYRDGSQRIEGLQNSALGKLVGQDFANAVGDGSFNQIPGEAVMSRLRQLPPSQIAASKKLLQSSDPEAWQSVKGSLLQSALEQAQHAPASAGANALPANTNVFVSALAKTPQDQARLAHIFEPGELNQVQDALNAARRLGDRTGVNFSGTGSYAELTALGMSAGHALASPVTGIPQLAAMIATPRAMARVISNSQGRAAIQQLSRLPLDSERARKLTAQLSALAGEDYVNAPAQ